MMTYHDFHFDDDKSRFYADKTILFFKLQKYTSFLVLGWIQEEEYKCELTVVQQNKSLYCEKEKENAYM